MSVREFKINEHLTLKLNDKGETRIFVAGVDFRQCKYLLLNIPVQNLTDFEELKSIDEVALKLDNSLEHSDDHTQTVRIPPETEFWGHCSNLQVWYEHNYRTNLLHSNLAFPLLGRLAEVGDSKAKKIFKEEITRRYNTGVESVRKYLRKNNYLQRLSTEEFHSLLNPEEYDVVEELRKLQPNIESLGIDIKNRRIIRLYLNPKTLVPDPIRKLKGLEVLRMNYLSLKELPEWIGELRSLKELQMYDNELTELPESIGNLKSLTILDVHNNKLSKLPRSIGELKSLRELILHNNWLRILPEIIGNFANLEVLRLSNNSLETLPKSIGKCKVLQKLSLSNNKLDFIPRSLGYCLNLKRLSLDNNQFRNLPSELGKLNKLEFLDISFNPISKFIDSLFSLQKLKELWVLHTNLNKSVVDEAKFQNKYVRVLHKPGFKKEKRKTI